MTSFETGNFAHFEQFQINSHFTNIGQVQIVQKFSFLLTLGRSQLFQGL